MQHKFTDDKGREWAIEINLLTVRRMKAGGFDFFSLEEKRAAKLQELSRDDYVLAEWIFANVKPQADERGVGFEDFITALMGDSLYSAREAWEEAYRNFTPTPGMRSALERIAKTKKDMQAHAVKETQRGADNLAIIAERRKAELTARVEVSNLEKLVNEEMAQPESKSNATFSASADSLVSTPSHQN